MLGTEAAAALSAAGLDFIGSGRELDIRDPAAIAAFARGRRLSWIVNCAAYTDVDGAEAEPEAAMRLNADGPANLAALASRIGTRILHVSTDYVFDGAAERPYLEDDPTCPINAYGRSKAAGEERVRAICAEHVILRSAWLYGIAGRNFVSKIIELLASDRPIGVVADQRGTPTSAADLAGAMAAIAGAAEPCFGTFHYTDLGEASRYEVALEIMRQGLECGLLHRDRPIRALTSMEYATSARRPAYSALSTAKIVNAYGLRIPDWKESLAIYIKDLRA
jgi:dTDP-4-dehydrorhamnose reductase